MSDIRPSKSIQVCLASALLQIVSLSAAAVEPKVLAAQYAPQLANTQSARSIRLCFFAGASARQRRAQVHSLRARIDGLAGGPESSMKLLDASLSTSIIRKRIWACSRPF